MNENHDPKSGQFSNGSGGGDRGPNHGEPRQHPLASANAHAINLTLNKKGVVPGYTKHEFIRALKEAGSLKNSYIKELKHQWGHEQHYGKQPGTAEMASISGFG